jgi:hypothetical protein
MSDMWEAPVVTVYLNIATKVFRKGESDSEKVIDKYLLNVMNGAQAKLVLMIASHERMFAKHVYVVKDEKGESEVSKQDFMFFLQTALDEIVGN